MGHEIEFAPWPMFFLVEKARSVAFKAVNGNGDTFTLLFYTTSIADQFIAHGGAWLAKFTTSPLTGNRELANFLEQAKDGGITHVAFNATSEHHKYVRISDVLEKLKGLQERN